MIYHKDVILMYLEENLKRLNDKYNPFGIAFAHEGNIIKVKEESDFIINNYPAIKKELRLKYKMQFSSELLWHIKKDGINILKTRSIKTKPTKSIDELSEELNGYIDMINEGVLKDSIKTFLSNNHEFFNLPAAQIKHHAYEGGLLEHTLQTIKLSLAILDCIDDEVTIDKDLIIAGAILHDVGKINCYEITENGIEITDIFLKQEHIINGITLISQNIKSENIDELIHIVASHHNIKDWGSLIEPKSKEAWIIHFTENLSSKILG